MDKRTSVPLSRAGFFARAPEGALHRLMPLVALLSAASFGCPGQELAPLGPCTVSAVSERVDQAGVSDVDLLFVIDNSGSMASEQAKIAKELPRLVQVLTTGDRCAGTPEASCTLDDTKEPKRHFTAVKALHLGVVSVNAGGIDDPKSTQLGVTSCAGVGDDGKLQTSVDVAKDGVIAGNREFQDYAQGEVVIDPDPDCDIGDQPRYQEYTAGGKETPAQVAQKFACVARLGVRGCSFEQQLESMWKALAPSQGDGPPELYKFLNGSHGQGDGYNKGFLREDAILAIISVSDEEDCSIKDAGKVLFLQTPEATEEYGALNLRCGLATDRPDVDDLIQPTSRYIDGLKSLKPDNPDRILFAAIVGIPEDADKLSPEDILDLPEMQFAENPLKLTFPRTSCTGMTGTRIDEAYPPRRFMEVAAGFGENAVVYSICKDDYAPALDTLIGKIASKLKGNCLPRKLNPDANGRVNCQVFELLNAADTAAKKCVPARGHTGMPIKHAVRENGKIVQKTACEMEQVTVTNQVASPTGKGWYYDDFSAALKDDCQVGEQQRIQFKFADGTSDLPSGAGATFECFQPVARIDNNAKGFDAINTSCLMDKNACADRGNETEPGGYKLICIETSNSCQIACSANPDCPPGWVCDHAGGDGNTKGPLYCQLPTCPADSSSSASTTAM
jgi:hypothetical protein